MDELRPDQGKRLRAGTSLLRPAHTWALLGIVLGLPVAALLGILAVAALAADGPICPAIWSALRAELVNDPVNRSMLWAAAVLLPLATVLLFLEASARLRLDDTGLEVDIPRPLGLGWFRQTSGRWSVRWDEVRRVRLVGFAKGRNTVQQLGWYRLVLDTAHGEKWLAAFRWHEPGADHRLGLGELFAYRKLNPAARLRSAPLVRALEARGFTIEADGASQAAASPGFDLARHKGLLALVALFFVAGLYALIDSFFVRRYLALQTPPAVPFLLAGTVAAFAAWKLGKGAPRLERRVVGALAVAACLAATHPAMLRVNAVTARAETLSYISLGEGRFEPPGEGWPAINLSRLAVPEYWAAYPPGTPWQLTLLKGTAGFYQLDLAPVFERTRRFYRAARAGE